MWSQGDGGPCEEPAPDGGTGYYYIGRARRLYRADEIAEDEELNAMHEALWALADRAGSLPRDDDRTLDNYLRSQGVSGSAWALAEAGYGNTVGSTLSNVGLAAMIACEKAWEKDEEGGDYRWAHSWAPFLNWLKEGLDIRTGWEVSAVDASEQQVVVTGSAGQRLDADAVVVTAPLPILQQDRICFTPPLSQGKRDALAAMHMSNGMKAILQFNRRCWPEDCHGVVAADEFFPEMWMNTNGGVGGWEPVEAEADRLAPTTFTVTAFAMGPNVERILQYDAPTIIMRAVCQLQRMFGMGAAEPGALQAGVVYDWASHHRTIGGAYTVAGPSETSPELFARVAEEIGEEAAKRVTLPARRLLAEPHADRKVFFAGEATSGAYEEDSPMTVHGALVTGGRAAREIAQAWGVADRKPVQEEVAMES